MDKRTYIILLTLYPLLLFLFELKLRNGHRRQTTPRTFSDATETWSQTCIESSNSMVRTLNVLRQQDLLGGLSRVMQSRRKWLMLMRKVHYLSTSNEHSPLLLYT